MLWNNLLQIFCWTIPHPPQILTPDQNYALARVGEVLRLLLCPPGAPNTQLVLLAGIG